jgi:HEPN domain-containing protein
MSVRASQHDLARELFVRTADENYIAARWCAAQRLDADFLWLAVHALEKYLKAVLLVNGRSTKGYGHDIVRLYAEVKALAGDLLPERLAKPADLDIYHWRERSAEEFIQHLLDNGNADNRYAIYGYATSSQDLHMLDQMAFAVRRLVCELDGRIFPGNDPQLPTVTHREILTRQPEWYSSVGMPLDDLIRKREDDPRRQAALNLNLPFAPEDYSHEPMRSGTSARNPVIMRRILDPLASDDPRWAAEGIQLAEWFLANVQVPKGKPNDPGVTEQIKAAIADARLRHNLP